MTSILAAGRRRRLLHAMGIDVFVRRGPKAVPAETALAAPSSPEPRAATKPMRRSEPSVHPAPAIAAPPPTAAAVAGPEWDLLALGGVAGVVVGRFESPEERRLANGIYVALGDLDREPVQARFQWPPDGLGERDAREAVTALTSFLRGQVERNRAGCLVLLGEDLAALDVAAAVPIVRGPAARALIGDANGKRALWRQIATSCKR